MQPPVCKEAWVRLAQEVLTSAIYHGNALRQPINEGRIFIADTLPGSRDYKKHV
jgi:hypothetical protein